MSKKEKRNLARIITALLLFLCVFIIDKICNLAQLIDGNYGWLLPFGLYLLVYLLIGYDVLFKAGRNICHGQVFDENFLMCVATLGAFALAISRGISGLETEGFDEACAVLLFYQVGEFFQRFATGRSRRSISALMDIRPDSANVLREGETVVVDPSEVEVGEIIVINPGEKIPLDGVVTKGVSALDTKPMTGESILREVGEGSEVISGCVNLTSQIFVKVTKAFYDSTVSKILDLVENASDKKSPAENFITKFAKFYTPSVVGVAILLAIIPGLVTGEWAVWIYRALSFLVVSCPCALVISIPLSFFAGLGAASRYKILIKGSNYLEKFNKANIFVFDKTGTLTKGNFAVTKIYPEERAENILRLAAIAERDSNHPIAKSIIKKYGQEIKERYTLTNVAGQGIVAKNGDDVIYCGNDKLMNAYAVDFDKVNDIGTVVYVAHNNVFIGSILISDEIKEETKDVITQLNRMQAKTFMLTGDNAEVASHVASEVGLTGYNASLLPQNKVDEVEKMLAKKQLNEVLCFVGDGINDAPVLMRSDIGVAMGGVGSDAAIEAADIVLMEDDLRGLTLAKKIARKTMAVVKENIIFSLAVKGIILILSAFGIANMWFAVFGDVGVAIIAILNAMRVNGKYR